MKKLLLLASLTPAFLFAQQNSDTTARPKKLIKVVSFSLYGGGETYREGFEDRSVFQQAAPQSSLAFADISTYNQDDGFFIRYGNANSSKGLNAALSLHGQKHSELRVGIAHSTTSYAYQSYTKESRTFIGTSTLPGGEVVTTDSVTYASYTYGWNADIIHLNAAWILRSNPNNWVNVYTGFGGSAGIGYNGVLEYNHSHSSEFQHSSSVGGSHYTSNRTVISEVTERYRAPLFGAYSIYIPIGFNVRLGKRSHFLSHMALFGEYNGALNILKPANMDAKLRTSSGGYGGIRWYVHAPKGERRFYGPKKDYRRGDGMVH